MASDLGWEIGTECLKAQWFEDCDLYGDETTVRAMTSRYIEEQGLDGRVCGGRDTDYEAGDEVIVRNDAGVIVGVSVLESGIETARPGLVPFYIWFECPLRFEVKVTAASPFYSISVSGVDGPTMSSDELADSNWYLDLSPESN